MHISKMRDTKDGGRVLDVSAHVLSRALVSQSAPLTCCTLDRGYECCRVTCSVHVKQIAGIPRYMINVVY